MAQPFFRGRWVSNIIWTPIAQYEIFCAGMSISAGIQAAISPPNVCLFKVFSIYEITFCDMKKNLENRLMIEQNAHKNEEDAVGRGKRVNKNVSRHRCLPTKLGSCSKFASKAYGNR
jgi:hypothetical protein